MSLSPFIPPLRGWLTMQFFTLAGILECMIYLFGGIRFRGMDPNGVDQMQFLSDSCAEKLETSRFDPGDPEGEVDSLNGVQVITDDLSVE